MTALFLWLIAPPAHACCSFNFTDVEWSVVAPPLDSLPGAVTVSFVEASDRALQVTLANGRTEAVFEAAGGSAAHAEVASWRSACAKGPCPDVTVPLDGGHTWSLAFGDKVSGGYSYTTTNTPAR